MKPIFLAAGALALSGPALAQMQVDPVPGTTAASSAKPQNPTVSSQTRVDTPAAQAQIGVEASVEPTTVAAPSDPKALIASEFPSYDKDGNGNLDKTEFAAWMTALKTKSGQPSLPAAEQTKWTSGAFATADKDKSKSVSLVELQSYLTVGA